MRLYIKQKVFSWKDSFDVFNERGDKILRCKGDEGLTGNRFEIFEGKKEVAKIHEKIIKLRPKYHIETENEEFEIVKKAVSVKDGFKVKELDWEIGGNFFNHDYTIKSGKEKIAKISKKEFAKVNSYEIDIEKGIDPVNVISCVICINGIMSALEEEEK